MDGLKWMDSKVVRAEFGSGLICPRAQTCCALKSSAPSGARQDDCADSGSACKLAGVQIIPLPTLANQILARTLFRLRRAFVCVSSRWKVLSGEFRRRPTSLAIKSRKPDRVGRRGLSEPREDFSRLNTCVFPRLCLWLFPSLIRLRAQPLKNSAGRVPQAADVTCNKISQIRSCRSPRTV